MRKERAILFGVLCLWLAVMAAGTAAMNSYSNSPGLAGEPPSTWPDDCGLARDSARHTLLLFLHPQCPCSRACLRELARTMSNCGNKLDVCVLFVHSADVTEEWVRCDLWKSADAMPGVRVQADSGGTRADRFAVRTSGHALLYDAAGRLQFSGGITAARGHEGDNAGRSAIESFVRGRKTGRKTCSVFGCPLKNPT